MNILVIKLSYRHLKNILSPSIRREIKRLSHFCPILIHFYSIRTRGTNSVGFRSKDSRLWWHAWYMVDNPCIDIVNNLHHFPDLNGDGEISSNDLIETVQRLMWPHQNECIDTAEAEHVARIVSFHTAWCKSR